VHGYAICLNIFGRRVKFDKFEDGGLLPEYTGLVGLGLNLRHFFGGDGLAWLNIPGPHWVLPGTYSISIDV
jgi:hypothetical protein